MTIDEILKLDYNADFDEKCKQAIVMSHYKYGEVKANYTGSPPNVDCAKTLEERWALYKLTGNTQYLIDVANQARIEFTYPQHPKAHYQPKDSGDRLVGLTVNEAKRFKELGEE